MALQSSLGVVDGGQILVYRHDVVMVASRAGHGADAQLQVFNRKVLYQVNKKPSSDCFA